MPIIIFSSKDERLYVDWIACCVDFYNFAVDNIDIKEYTTLFRLKCVFTQYIDDVDSDSHSYGLSYNDSGLFSDSSVGSDVIESYFSQDSDSYENEYLQELDIDTNDNNNDDFELVQ